jgi:hypothetical protein
MASVSPVKSIELGALPPYYLLVVGVRWSIDFRWRSWEL